MVPASRLDTDWACGLCPVRFPVSSLPVLPGLAGTLETCRVDQLETLPESNNPNSCLPWRTGSQIETLDGLSCLEDLNISQLSFEQKELPVNKMHGPSQTRKAF